jgi:hypothetical protein
MKRRAFTPLLLISLSFSTFLNGRQLHYKMINNSDQYISLRLVPDRDLHAVIIDQARDNGVYSPNGLHIQPGNIVYIDFATSGTSRGWQIIKKRWGIKEILIDAWSSLTTQPYSQTIRLTKQEALKELTITVMNEANTNKVVIYYE